MSEELPGPVPPPERPFAADRPKNNRAKCKRCKQPTEPDKLRVGRYVVNGFNAAGGWTKAWFHPACMWEAFAKQRASTKKIEDPAKDIDGWEDLAQEDMDEIVQYLRSTGATGRGLWGLLRACRLKFIFAPGPCRSVPWGRGGARPPAGEPPL